MNAENVLRQARDEHLLLDDTMMPWILPGAVPTVHTMLALAFNHAQIRQMQQWFSIHTCPARSLHSGEWMYDQAQRRYVCEACKRLGI